MVRRLVGKIEDENMNRALVIIPTYNEIENIEGIIRAVLSQDKQFHLLTN